MTSHNGNGSNVQADQASTVTRHLSSQTDLLRALVAEDRTDIFDIAVADNHHGGLVMDNWPVAGSKRVIVNRTTVGTDSLQVPTTGIQAISTNVGRLGGAIVNYGTNPVILYLWDGATARPGKGAIWLAAAGGSWDFRLGNVLWSGNVTAVAQGGTSTLTVCEV
jgi:hypothetical protein